MFAALAAGALAGLIGFVGAIFTVLALGRPVLNSLAPRQAQTERCCLRPRRPWESLWSASSLLPPPSWVVRR
jgi:hypothetical protein